MILTSLYVLGPAVAFAIGVVIYVLERAPVVVPRWLRLMDELKVRHRHKRERPPDAN